MQTRSSVEVRSIIAPAWMYVLVVHIEHYTPREFRACDWLLSAKHSSLGEGSEASGFIFPEMGTLFEYTTYSTLFMGNIIAI